MKYLQRLVAYILSFLPSPLPIGLVEFETWADSIIALLPNGFKDVPTWQLKTVLATMVMHLNKDTARISKRYLVKLLCKAAANQVAGQVFESNKELQKKLEQEKAAATATAETANEPGIQKT